MFCSLLYYLSWIMSTCTWEECVFWCHWIEFYIYIKLKVCIHIYMCIYLKTHCFIVLLKSSISFIGLQSKCSTIIESSILKSPSIILEHSVSHFNSVSVCFIYFKALLFEWYIFIIFMYFWLNNTFINIQYSSWFFYQFWLKFYFSHTIICTSALLLPFAPFPIVSFWTYLCLWI